MSSAGVPWVVLFGTNKLARRGPADDGHQGVCRCRIRRRGPERLALTGDDVVWYTDYARGFLGRFDPRTGDVREIAVAERATSRPSASTSPTAPSGSRNREPGRRARPLDRDGGVPELADRVGQGVVRTWSRPRTGISSWPSAESTGSRSSRSEAGLEPVAPCPGPTLHGVGPGKAIFTAGPRPEETLALSADPTVPLLAGPGARPLSDPLRARRHRGPRAGVAGGGPRGALPVRLIGVDFPNRVGLAAGLDKNAEHVDALAKLGFGFLEVGTVHAPPPGRQSATPPLPGPAGGRARRTAWGSTTSAWTGCSPTSGAHRTEGFSASTSARTSTRRSSMRSTTICTAFARSTTPPRTSSFNVSSPNTRDLRTPRAGHRARATARLADEGAARLADRSGRRVPLVIKLSPDLAFKGIARAAELVGHTGSTR